MPSEDPSGARDIYVSDASPATPATPIAPHLPVGQCGATIALTLVDWREVRALFGSRAKKGMYEMPMLANLRAFERNVLCTKRV